MAEIKRLRYDALDGLRAIACVGIVLMHVKCNMAIQPSKSFITESVIGFTHDFVLLFMMVSAFALSCGYNSKFQSGSIKMGDFYKKRYTRILPFFALLSLIDVVKTIAEEHFHWTDALQGELWEAFTNLSLLFALIPGNDITVVGVGWFLGVIFLFYLCYPFFTVLISSKKSAWIAFALSIGLYFALKCYFYPVKGSPLGNNAFMYCAPFFLSGGIIYLYRNELVSVSACSVSVKCIRLLLTIGYTVWFFVFPEMRFPLANLVMYALWLIYAVTEVGSNGQIALLNNNVMEFLSGISMEVYLCHMMMFRFVEKNHVEKFCSKMMQFVGQLVSLFYVVLLLAHGYGKNGANRFC